MDQINEVVLESAVVILSGGTDKAGIPLLTFPIDSADLMDIYPMRDILDLMKTFVDLCGGKVSVLADLQQGWSTECITKLSHLLDQLQKCRKKCLSSAYLIHSNVGTRDDVLQRPMSRDKTLSTYTLKHLDTLEELYLHVDKTQLTTDYGGSLQYNHVAWVDFQRTYLPLVTNTNVIAKSLPRLKEKIFKLQEVTIDKCNDSGDTFRKIVKTKYEHLLKKHDVRGIVEYCHDAIDRLEHPDCDPTLIQTHRAIVRDTKFKLTSALSQLEQCLTDLDVVASRTIEEHALFAKLKDCKENTKEVEETIELMMSQADGLPLASSSEVQAKYNREMFNATVLVPSQDIVSCATSILQDLNCDDTSSTAYVMAEAVAKRLSESIQPFIQHLNHLNEVYTRLHLFHVIVSKTKRWNKKASCFISKILVCCDKKPMNNNKDMCDSSSQLNHAPVVPRLRLDDFYDIDSTVTCQRIIPPTNWTATLKHFYKKHPPPKKKHIRLLNKFVPSNVDQRCRSEAEILAERTLFILQLLLKHEFKIEDLVMIQKWTCCSNDNGIDHCFDVTPV